MSWLGWEQVLIPGLTGKTDFPSAWAPGPAIPTENETPGKREKWIEAGARNPQSFSQNTDINGNAEDIPKLPLNGAFSGGEGKSRPTGSGRKTGAGIKRRIPAGLCRGIPMWDGFKAPNPISQSRFFTGMKGRALLDGDLLTFPIKGWRERRNPGVKPELTDVGSKTWNWE